MRKMWNWFIGGGWTWIIIIASIVVTVGCAITNQVFSAREDLQTAALFNTIGMIVLASWSTLASVYFAKKAKTTKNRIAAASAASFAAGFLIGGVSSALTAAGCSIASWALWVFTIALAGFIVLGLMLLMINLINWEKVVKFFRRVAKFFRNRPWIWFIIAMVVIALTTTGTVALNARAVGDTNTIRWQGLLGGFGAYLAFMCIVALIRGYDNLVEDRTVYWRIAKERADKAEEDYEAFGEQVAKTTIPVANIPRICTAWRKAMLKPNLHEAILAFANPLNIGEMIKLEEAFVEAWKATHEADQTEIRLDQMKSDPRIYDLIQQVALRYNSLVREGSTRHRAAMEAPKSFFLGLYWMSPDEVKDLRIEWQNILCATLPERIEVDPPTIKLIGGRFGE